MKIELIPAIDIIDGKCVRLTKGDYGQKKVYNDDPVAQANEFEKLGADKVILGADVRNGLVSINGWKEDTSEKLLPFLARYVKAGVKNVLCTEISRDGTLSGPSTDLYREVMEAFPGIHLIASGGVGRNEDIIELDEAGIPAVVFGKAWYEGKINLEELKA